MPAVSGLRTLGGLVVALCLVSSVPAAAGPTASQPATQGLTNTKAREVSEFFLDDLVTSLPKPRQSQVSNCYSLNGNPLVKRCSLEWTSPDSDCTAASWVWRDADSFYFEFHRMRCS